MNREQIGKLAIQSNRIFLDSARELMASFDAVAVEQAMTSWIRLHYSEQVGDSEPSLESFLKLQEIAFISLFDRGALESATVADITPLGEKALQALRRHCGVGVEQLPAPEPILTSEQRLEQEVLADWHNLPSAKIKAKMNASKSYRAMFEKLSATDSISSQATLHTVISGA